ncbi:MAG TPA: glycosyltransferase family 39 protein [Gemmatimonadales bacterium]|nr:glycosyltransferase family 39 protein [Gemmatimonadales bacterium]
MAWWPAAALGAFALILHAAVNLLTPYGFHRDELLYLAMGRHLRLWAMDFPPGIALLSETVRATLGDSLSAIRFVPALAGSLLAILAALASRELGGGRWAQSLAAFAVVANPLFLRSANLFQPVVFDQVAWTLALYALLRLCHDSAPRWWLLLGTALGLGLLTKFSAAFLALAIAMAVLLSPRRAWLRTPWPWVAAVLAMAIGSPSIVGQIRLDWPVLGQMAELRSSQLARVTPADFMLDQLRWGPATVAGLIGLGALLFHPALRRFRVVGWTCAVALAILLGLHGKAYYAGPLYPTLIGAGTLVLERVQVPRPGRIVRWGFLAALACFVAGTLPLSLPLLPPDPMARYAQAIGATAALRTNTGEIEALPQDYADMLGWEAQVRAVADVYRSLPAPDRRRAVLVAANYGEAGALDFFGPRYGLPPVVSPTGSYWFFGPGTKPGEVVITIGVDRADLEPMFATVVPAKRIGSTWSVAEERDLTIYVARRPRRTLQEIWPSFAGRN